MRRFTLYTVCLLLFGSVGCGRAEMDGPTAQDEEPAAAQQASEDAEPVPIVGSWSLDPAYGTYEHHITVRADGSYQQRLMGEDLAGTWNK